MTRQAQKFSLTHKSTDSPRWDTIHNFLKTGQYEQVVELLHNAQAANHLAGDHFHSEILVAVQQLCWLCSQCRAQVKWHRHTAEELNKREQALSQQLEQMLAWLNGQAAHLAAEPAAPTGPRCGESNREVEGVASSLKIYCLGPFRVYYNDQLITTWNSLKARSIFKYLIAHQGAPIAKDILMDVFWPEADPEAARRNLHQAIYSLRQTLKQGHTGFQPIYFENDCYLLNPDLAVWLDYIEFEKHVQAGQRLESAGRLAEAEVEYSIAGGYYQGDFLEEDLYEDWVMLQREYLRSTYLDLADRLSEYYLQQGRYGAAISLCQKILNRDNCHEEAHRRLMKCYLAQDQGRLAVRQYQTCVQALKAELGVPPAAKTQSLYKQVIEGVRGNMPAKLETLSV